MIPLRGVVDTCIQTLMPSCPPRTIHQEICLFSVFGVHATDQHGRGSLQVWLQAWEKNYTYIKMLYVIQSERDGCLNTRNKVIKKEELYSVICKSQSHIQDMKPSQSKRGVSCTYSEISHKALSKNKEGSQSERREAAQWNKSEPPTPHSCHLRLNFIILSCHLHTIL